MKRILIVGAGGFGRELLAWAKHDRDYGRAWTIVGFLDDNPNALEACQLDVPVVGTIESYVPAPDEALLCAIGKPDVKRRIVGLLNSRGATFQRFIHPSVVIGERVVLGAGVVLCPGVILTSDIHCGDFVMVNCHSSAGHDVCIGNYTTVSGHCDLTGYVTVGEGVFMGSRASVIPGRNIGNGATIGAGAVVISHVPPGVTMFGNPARRLT